MFHSRILLLSSLTFIACPNDVRGRRPWVLHSHGLTWFAFSLYSGKSDPFGDSPQLGRSPPHLLLRFAQLLQALLKKLARSWKTLRSLSPFGSYTRGHCE